MTMLLRKLLIIVGGVILIAAVVLNSLLPELASRLLLYPSRRAVAQPAPKGCEDVTFEGYNVVLRGWHCRTAATRRGTLVYLYGVGSNRTAGTGVIERFTARGFDVVAYDSRAHGESDGDICTYGYFEKQDLHRIIDTLEAGPIVLLGSSMGAAIALQEAADDPRVSVVVAAEAYSDLRTVAVERAPFILSDSTIEKAFRIAERRGNFIINDVDVVKAARRISVPVLVIHGAADQDTVPSHSERIHAALSARKRYIPVPAARHNESLNRVWKDIEQWIDGAVPGSP
jgi:pimeloyl-ACP methyl ester carboxylesterase